jgi:hypothetical protein
MSRVRACPDRHGRQPPPGNVGSAKAVDRDVHTRAFPPKTRSPLCVCVCVCVCGLAFRRSWHVRIPEIVLWSSRKKILVFQKERNFWSSRKKILVFQTERNFWSSRKKFLVFQKEISGLPERNFWSRAVLPFPVSSCLSILSRPCNPNPNP